MCFLKANFYRFVKLYNYLDPAFDVLSFNQGFSIKDVALTNAILHIKEVGGKNFSKPISFIVFATDMLRWQLIFSMIETTYRIKFLFL